MKWHRHSRLVELAGPGSPAMRFAHACTYVYHGWFIFMHYMDPSIYSYTYRPLSMYICNYIQSCISKVFVCCGQLPIIILELGLMYVAC